MNSRLTPKEIQSGWATWEESLVDTCQIKAAVDTTDGNHGYGQSWSSVTQTVACAVLDDQAGASGLGGEIDIIANQKAKMIWLPRTTVIAAPDRIIANGVTYQTVQATNPGTYGPGVACICVEV